MKKLLIAAFATVLMSGSALADTTLKLVEVITSPERTETLKSIVGKFDRPWFERPIFGQIRYMSGASTGKKFAETA
jgi:hypothetical protein